MSVFERLTNTGGGTTTTSVYNRLTGKTGTDTSSSSVYDRLIGQSNTSTKTKTVELPTRTPSFNETNLGIAVNTIKGLPRATASVFKSMFIEAPARAASSVTLSVLGRKEQVPVTSVEKFFLGDEPVKSMKVRAEETKKTLESFGVSPEISGVFAPVGVLGITAIDLYPGTAGKGKILTKLAEETSETVIKTLLKKEIKNISEKAIEEIAPQIAKTTDKKVIESIISSSLSKEKKVISQAVSQEADTLLQQQARELPTAEAKSISEATKAKGISSSKYIPKIEDESISPTVKNYISDLVTERETARNIDIPSSIKDRTTQFYNEVKKKLVDFSAPIEDVLRTSLKKSKISILPEYDISNQIDRVLKSPTIAGQFVRDTGLEKVIKEVPDLNALDQYLISKQAIDVNTRGITTGRNFAMDSQLVKELAPKYEQYANIVTDYSRKLLDYTVDSGLISPEMATLLKKRYPNYVPLKRIFTEAEKAGGEFGSKAIASLSKQTIVRPIKGSERAIEGPTKSILEMTADAFKQGEKNKAAKLLASYEKLPGNPFGLVPLRTTENVTKRIELFSLAKDLKPIQDRVAQIIKSSSKELSKLKSEIDSLNKLGVKEYLKSPSKEILKPKISGIEAKYRVFPESRQILEGKPVVSVVREQLTTPPLSNTETKRFIEQLITDRNINLESIKRKILNREPKVVPLIEKIEKLRDEFQGIKELRTTAIDEAQLLADAQSRGKSTITFLDNGVKNIYETTPDVANAAKALNVQQLNVLGKILAAPVRLAKIGITGINLPFIAANISKDHVTGIINSQNALKTSIANPAVFWKSLLEAVGHGKVYDEMIRNGALGTSFDISRNAAPLTLERIRAGKTVASKIKYTVTHPSELLRAVEDIIGRSEELTRIQQYQGTKQAMLAKGMLAKDAEVVASRAARENTVNFARRGEWGQVLNSAFLYLNANIQGTRTFVRNLKERPVQTAVKVATFGFAPVAAATAWNLYDPKRRAAYEDISEFEKKNNIIFIPPNPTKNEDGTWNVIKIPISQEILNLVGMARRPIEQLYGLDPVAVKDIADAFIGTVSPVGTTKEEILSTLTPQAIKPSIESAVNRNLFTGIPIVPASMEKLSPENQYKPYTSGTARIAGKVLGASPLKVEAFVKGTFGGIGSQVINVIDTAMAGVGIIPKNQIGGQNVVKAIVSRFALARGGQSEQLSDSLSKMVTNQADEQFRIRQEAEILYTAMKTLPKEEAAKKFNELLTVNPLTAKALSSIAEDEKLGLSYADRVVKSLGVQNGNRAKFIVQELNNRKTKEEKAALWSDYVNKKIITPQVSVQINSLLNK